MDRTGLEPAVFRCGEGRIRTDDLPVAGRLLYRTELHPQVRVRKPLSGYALGLAAPAGQLPSLLVITFHGGTCQVWWTRPSVYTRTLTQVPVRVAMPPRHLTVADQGPAPIDQGSVLAYCPLGPLLHHAPLGAPGLGTGIASTWSLPDLNRRPSACHAGALPDCAKAPSEPAFPALLGRAGSPPCT